VIDSTWYPYTLPLVRELPGPCVEVRCQVGVDLVRQRYRTRRRDERHLDALRSEDELWGEQVPPLGIGPLLSVDTSQPVDVAAVAARVRGLVVAPDR